MINMNISTDIILLSEPHTMQLEINAYNNQLSQCKSYFGEDKNWSQL